MRTSSDNLREIEQGIKRAFYMEDQLIRTALNVIAEQSVAYALEAKGYENRTFNLHDSYGYGIFIKGQLVKVKMTQQEATVEDKWEGYGHDRGYIFITQEYVPEFPYEVVVVAGEFYARTLEVTFGLDVLTQGYQYAASQSAATFQRIAKRMTP